MKQTTRRPSGFGWGLLIGLICAGCAAGWATPSAGQQPDLLAQFDAAIGRWKQAAKDAILARQQYVVCEQHEAEQIAETWTKAVQLGREQYDLAIRLASQIVEQSPEQFTPDVASLLSSAITTSYDSGDYETAAQLSDKILSSAAQSPPSILSLRVLTAYALNDFENCKIFLERYKQLGVPLMEQMKLIDRHLDNLMVAWQREQALRAEESERDDLPRVRLVCDVDGQNEVILELFEDSAPRNVANFLALVKRGFYDNLTFHQVLTHIAAISGSPGGDGAEDPPYLVRGEADSPNARHSFRGAVAMASLRNGNLHGTQFYIALAPSVDNSADATIIGRVISGMDVINRLNITHVSNDKKKTFDRIDGVPASKILKVEVIRDRGHDYQPEPIGGMPGG